MIGTANHDRSRCLPWAMDIQCVVCEEVCPVSPKAIYSRTVEIVNRDGKTKRLKQPYVDADQVRRLRHLRARVSAARSRGRPGRLAHPHGLARRAPPWRGP